MSDDNGTSAPAPARSSATDAIARTDIALVKDRLTRIENSQAQCTSAQISTAAALGKIETDIGWLKTDREERIARNKRIWAALLRLLAWVGVPGGAIAAIVSAVGG